MSSNNQITNDIFDNLTSNNNKYTNNMKIFDNNNLVELINKTNEGLLIISNHPSFIDFCIFKRVFEDCYCVTNIVDESYYSDEEYIEKFNIIPYHSDKLNGGELVKNIIKKLIDEGKKVLIFPEGTYEYDGVMLPFKKGIFHLAYNNNFKVLTCTIKLKSNIPSKLIQSICYSLQIPVQSPQIELHINEILYNTRSFDELYNRSYQSILNKFLFN